MKLITKIKKADFPKKTTLWYSNENTDRESLLQEMILSLPKGSYKLHDRSLGWSIVEKIYDLYGIFPSLEIKESTLLGMEALYPHKIYVSFTLGLDIIEIK